MEKVKRGERLAVMAQILQQSPNKIFSFSYFCDLFDTAKSTVSEDTAILSRACRHFGLGTVETVIGASGGVRYRCTNKTVQNFPFVQSLAEQLCDESRVLPGGYLYFSDILSDPELVGKIGRLIAGLYYTEPVDFVLTMETKGIPMALETAGALHVPLVIARHSVKVYEGSAVNISYVSGSGKIETMALSRRAVKEGQNALIVDDFTRGGGTAEGLKALMHEFNAQVTGVCFLLALEDQARQFAPNERALMVMDEIKQGDRRANVRPSGWV